MLTLIGILGWVAPGLPGWPFVIMGLSTLSREVPLVRRLMRRSIVFFGRNFPGLYKFGQNAKSKIINAVDSVFAYLEKMGELAKNLFWWGISIAAAIVPVISLHLFLEIRGWEREWITYVLVALALATGYFTGKYLAVRLWQCTCICHSFGFNRFSCAHCKAEV
ncbi:MAG: hypothetical protein HYW89_01210 [Candidatus Sungiibacteriota bacterium]|uniref:DUF454 domain-containing protein n=1 Tax=Candidatus Sungiibacteriota bacterium TaxID=2750080 RepID=A0A7T5RK28_9BACT|nr:MAG: hypothetical protein HYW89_01210 [Candidatus Sungbacteria bacterium]